MANKDTGRTQQSGDMNQGKKPDMNQNIGASQGQEQQGSRVGQQSQQQGQTAGRDSGSVGQADQSSGGIDKDL